MRTSLLLMAFALLATFNNFAQTDLPYFTAFDNSSQTEGWQEYRLGAESEFYYWEISSASPFSAPSCLSHNYPVGGSELTDDWFVSPGFNLPDGGTIDSLRYAFSGFGVPQDGDTVAVYVLTGSQDPANATSMTMIMDFRGEDYASDNTWRILSDVSIPASNETTYLAFRYTTVVNWLDVRFDNLRISSNTTIAVDEKSGFIELTVYPNPVSDIIFIESNHSNFEAKTVDVYDLGGKRVMSKRSVSDKINVSELDSGTYLMVIESNGVKLQRSFVKH